jgi:hypothetical protein
MNQVIECNGGHNYRIKHMNKARLERLDLLPPQSILVTDAAMDWDGWDNDDSDDSDDDDSV